MIKRYMVFSGMCYYPSGGMGDFRGSCDTLPEAIDLTGKSVDDDYDLLPEWWEIYDTHTCEIVVNSIDG